MPRPRLIRNVSCEPNTTYFKPAGLRKSELQKVILTIEEYEAIRLKDLSKLPQEKCAEMMHISQPTFHRVLISARHKIADAIINSKAIKIEGGKYNIK